MLQYNSQEIEAKWQSFWEENGIYRWDENVTRREDTYSIDTPPPTVSGVLHMGHVFSYTQADFIARFQRMRGKNVFYPIGFDDNGLPTERLVEKVKGIHASRVDRREFKALCMEVVSHAEEQFRILFKEIALSVDWRQEYQTISTETQKLSQMSFIDLLQKGRIVRKFAPTFWDCVDGTAIAQAEIEDKEKQGYMYDVAFHSSMSDVLVISTTRPELLHACVALLYHPDDDRYQHLEGHHATTPIFNNLVPIIPDADVDSSKGTGLVMCCTFGDIKDVEWWRRHKFEIKDSIDLFGRLKNAAEYTGLKVGDARQRIIEDLHRLDLIRDKKEVIQHVKCAERSGAALEIISTYQWYIKVLESKEALLAKGGECNWYPVHMKVRLDNWITGLNQDWCISRQRFFGVQFPVWYSKRKGEEGKVLVAEAEQLPVDPSVDLPKGYSIEEVIPETDVMDTWATSSLTPQINSKAITSELAIDYERHKKLYPFDLRVQAHEIIRTWTFGTIVKSCFHEDCIPWKSLMISGWCLAADKTKMSKSKGNVVTPKQLIVDHGSDVVRYWASSSKLGADLIYSDEMLKAGKRLVTKLWNASKFVKIHIESLTHDSKNSLQQVEDGTIYETADICILSRLQETVKLATEHFEVLDYSAAKSVIESFFWKDFCDNYLELVKKRLYGTRDVSSMPMQGQRSGICTMYHVFRSLLLLFAPIIPHITEEIYQNMFGSSLDQLSIHQRGTWPSFEECYYSDRHRELWPAVLSILELVRTFKSQEKIALNAPIGLVAYTGDVLDASIIGDLESAISGKLQHCDTLHTEVSFRSKVSTSDDKVSIYVVD
ncbi:valine--tRNA ligase [Rickettsiales endosymbiont of Peranema trichophorum]|uniref:valine--tRNA ligase n=1 Tax=Rickettsiales endosymbiont of Peranema trichophorum TaxID=2486577 RepID=UPI00397A35A8